MRKALVPFLVFGLLLLGMSPVMAAGKQVKAPAPVQQGEVVQVVVPQGAQVSEQNLSETSRKGLGAALLNGLREGFADAFKAGGVTYLATGDRTAALKAAALAFAVGFIWGGVQGLSFLNRNPTLLGSGWAWRLYPASPLHMPRIRGCFMLKGELLRLLVYMGVKKYSPGASRLVGYLSSL